MATNQTEDAQSNWEVVDGLQRLLTLVNFAGDSNTRDEAKLKDLPLRLQELDKLTTFERTSFSDLPEDIRTAFEDRPLKVILLNDKSDLQVRYDLFERLNTGGISLTPQEIRECVFRGEFIDLLGRLAETTEFKRLVVLPPSRWKDGTPEDFVLRFFAFRERYNQFEHSVTDFLNQFALDSVQNPMSDARQVQFDTTFKFLAATFHTGLRTRKGLTPVNLFEAVSVGASLAIEIAPNLKPPSDTSWTYSDELRRLTTGGTNSRKMVIGRIEYCRDKFLNR
jgi:hypothetical protein